MRRAVHQLKYHRDIGLADALAGSMISLYEETNWGIDLIVPVPLSIARLAERGYNQSVLIARPLALGVKLVYRSNALERTRDTRSQVDLNAKERKENVAGAFRARSRFVQNKRVLVVDDVATSGATLDACAVALLEEGALEVFGLTLARATYSSHKASP
jgi:competence protein ComFC